MELINYKQATEIVPLAETTLRIYVSRKKIPFYKIGKRVFFKPDELRAWIDARHVPAGA